MNNKKQLTDSKLLTFDPETANLLQILHIGVCSGNNYEQSLDSIDVVSSAYRDDIINFAACRKVLNTQCYSFVIVSKPEVTDLAQPRATSSTRRAHDCFTA